MTDRPLYFRVGELEAANELVRQYHYSKRPPANVQWVGTWHEDGGLFGDYGQAVAACFISIPPTRWSEPVYELTRLVRAPHVTKPLTGLISATLKHAAKNGADLIISFADKGQNHFGGIYQAASWHYHGEREPRADGIVIDGAFVHWRTCVSLWGSSVIKKLQAMMPSRKIEYHYDSGKYLYWRALSRAGEEKAKRLGLKKLPYPKPTGKKNAP